MSWTVTFVNALAEAEVIALPLDMSARFTRMAEKIVSEGLHGLREPHVKHLTGKLWEMWLTGRDGIARSIYMQRADSALSCSGHS